MCIKKPGFDLLLNGTESYCSLVQFFIARIFWYTFEDVLSGTSLVSPNQLLFRTLSNSAL